MERRALLHTRQPALTLEPEPAEVPSPLWWLLAASGGGGGFGTAAWAAAGQWVLEEEALGRSRMSSML